MNPNQKTGIDFKVIDTLRFISICLIVWGHCGLGIEGEVFHSTAASAIQSFAIQLGKIGTIIFFLISGFLLGPKIQSFTVAGFFKSRLKSTIIPWLIFVLLFGLINITESNGLFNAISERNFTGVFSIVFAAFKNIIFYVAYWFIVVFFISVTVLILFKKYINTTWIGVSLGLITLFYCINLHYGFISAHHTKAFLGYAFFVWAGIQISRNYEKFSLLLKKTSWWFLITMIILTFVIACYEGMALTKIHCVDPYASIRFSNVLNTLFIFIALFKMGHVVLINKLNPRRNVYGIYLLHNVLLLIQGNILKLHGNLMPNNIISFLNMGLLNFAVIIGLSLLLVATFKELQANPAIFRSFFFGLITATQRRYQAVVLLVLVYGFYLMLGHNTANFPRNGVVGDVMEKKNREYLQMLR